MLGTIFQSRPAKAFFLAARSLWVAGLLSACVTPIDVSKRPLLQNHIGKKFRALQELAVCCSTYSGEYLLETTRFPQAPDYPRVASVPKGTVLEVVKIMHDVPITSNGNYYVFALTSSDGKWWPEVDGSFLTHAVSFTGLPEDTVPFFSHGEAEEIR
jgi:hypothetical protein